MREDDIGPMSGPSRGTVPDRSGEPNDDGALKSVNLRDVVSVLRRHRWLVLLCVLLSTGYVAYRWSTQREMYQAFAVLRMINERRLLTEGVSGDPAVEMSGNPMLTQVHVLRSETVLGQAVDRTGFRLRSATDGFSTGFLAGVDVSPDAAADSLVLQFGDREWVAGSAGVRRQAEYGDTLLIRGVRFSVLRRPEVSRAVLQVASREAAIEMLRSAFMPRPREMTDLIDLQVASPEPGAAMRLVNAIAVVAETESARMAQEVSRQRREFIEKQLEQTDAQLAEAQLELSAFRESNEVYRAAEQISAEQARLSELDVQYAQLAAQRRSVQQLVERLHRSDDAGARDELSALMFVPSIAENGVLTQLYAQLVQYETERTGLLSGAGALAISSPEVQRLDGLLRTTRENLIAALENHLSSLTTQQNALEQRRAQLSTRVQALPGLEAEEARLRQRVDALAGLAAELRIELQRARIAETVQAGQVQVLDLAAAPIPVPGFGRKHMVMALLVGLFLGGMGGMLLEAINGSIRRPQEVESVLALRELAVVPSLRRGSSWLRRSRSGGGVRSASSVGNGEFARGAEAYRLLLANLRTLTTSQPLRSLVVTSSEPGEGKTTTSGNLAATLARHGERVLLIDADLRRPQLHRMFGISREPGLSDLLLGKAHPDEVIRPTGVENLYIVTAGTLTDLGNAELLSRNDLHHMLDPRGVRFSRIVFDTPPVSSGADAISVASHADGVLFVVRAGSTDGARAQRSVQQLARTGATVLGAVLNDPDAELPRYGKEYAYSYGYAAGASVPDE